jgi:hypothetical protein
VTSFTLAGRTVRAPVPDTWEADAADGRLRLARRVQDALPRPVIEIALRPAPNLRAALDEEIEGLVLRLTDFTILHVEARALRAENWVREAPPTPFVFAGYRQGLYSLVCELGFAGGDGEDGLLVLSVCLLEDAATLQPEIDAILDGLEVDWS